MKALKVAAIALAGLVGLLVLAAGALVLFVDPNHFRGTLESRVQQATGRPFTIDGALKLKLFPWLAVDVGKVALGNDAGFDAKPLLAVESARVGVRLLPLLHGDLEVSRVALDGVAINLVRRADGHTNWESLGKSSAPAPSAGEHAPTDVSVAGLDITHAALTLTDLGAHTLTRITQFELHAGAIAPAQPTALTIAADMDSGDATPQLRVQLRASVAADTAQDIATLQALDLRGQRTTAAANARPVAFSVASPQIVLDWKNGVLKPTTLDARLGDLQLSAEVSADQLLGDRNVTGSLRLPDQSPRQIAASLGIALPASRDAQALTHLSGTLKFALRTQTAAATDLDLTLDKTRLRGRLAITDLARSALEFDLTADALDIDAYRPPPAPVAKAPTAAATALPVAALRALNAHGKLAIGRVTLAALPLSDLLLGVSAAGGEIHLQPAAKAFGGTLNGDIGIDAAGDGLMLAVTQALRGVDLGAAVKAYAKSDRVSGRANADVKLSGRGATDVALVNALTGPIDFEVKDGALEGLDLSYEIERAQALIARQLPPARTGPARTPFTVLSGHSQLAHGTLTTDPLRIETPILKVTGKGDFRLADQAVNYQITTRLDQVPPQLANLKSLDIPITVTGTVQDYKVRPDLEGIVKARVKQELDKRKDELKDKLKDQLKNLLSR